MVPDELDSITTHGGHTFRPPLPFEQTGFRWRAGTTHVDRACELTGEMANAVVDDEIVASGRISTVEVGPTGDVAVLHVAPPSGGETPDDEYCFATSGQPRSARL